MGDVQMCATCGHNILRGEDFVCEIGDVPCAWVRQSVPHAAAVDRVVELEGEVGRLTNTVEMYREALPGTANERDEWKARAEKAEKEQDEANGRREAAVVMEMQADDELRSAEKERGAALARATAAEAELAMLMESTDGVRQAVGRWQERAREAEAREAGLKAALNMMDECCWQAWKAFTEEGPNAAEKFLHDVCITEGIMNNDGGRIPRAALAAPKEVKP